MNWNEQDIDNLISSVESTLAKADALAKSSLKKDDGQEDPAADAQAAAPAQDASSASPSADAQAAADQTAAPADDAAAPTDDQAQAAPEQGDQALQDEGQGDQPLSEEELGQIYSSMAPEELERHYAVIRQVLSQAYAQDGSDQAQPGQDAAAQAAPAPEAAQAAAPAEMQDDSMQKSEDKAKIASLEKTMAEQAEALKVITQAFETLARPQRKSVTDMQFIAKGEDMGGKAPMTSEEIRAKATALSKSGSLDANERNTINTYFLHKTGQDDVVKLINSKGGK